MEEREELKSRLRVRAKLSLILGRVPPVRKRVPPVRLYARICQPFDSSKFPTSILPLAHNGVPRRSQTRTF